MKTLRSMIFGIVLFLSLAVAIRAFADIKWKDYQELKKSKNTTLPIFFAGYLSGITWANERLGSEKRDRIFCIPEKLALNPQNLIQMLEDEYERNKSNYNDENPVGGILLFALINTFPCK